MSVTMLSPEIIVQAAREAVDDPTYDQTNWIGTPECKTSCCVLGRARLLAGVDPVDMDPREGEIPGGCMGLLGRLLRCPSSGVARLLAQSTIGLNGEIAAPGADLHGARLTGADLAGADLREADLRWADLRGANLCGADLREADLRGADLCGADLRGADLAGAIALHGEAP
jgi:hypothetical protein